MVTFTHLMPFFQMAATDIPFKEFKTWKPTLMHLNNTYKSMGTAQQLELLMQSICRLNPRRFLAKAEGTSTASGTTASGAGNSFLGNG